MHVEETYNNFKFPLGTTDASVVSFMNRGRLKIDNDNIADYPRATATRFFRSEIPSLPLSPISGEGTCISTAMVFSQSADLEPALAETLELDLTGAGSFIHNLLRGA